MTLKLLPFVTARMKPGDRFGLLTVTRVGKTKTGAHYAICDCDCGTKNRPVQMARLVNGKTIACGCQNGPSKITHGLSKTPLYGRWLGMHSRCYDNRNASYENYGGRGIVVCDRWHKLEAFVEDMSPGFAVHLQLDRIDTNGNYSPDNCRWATAAENTDNTRRSIFVEYNGQRRTFREWSAIVGIPRKLLTKRVIERGWSVEAALTTPVLSRAETARIANAASRIKR